MPKANLSTSMSTIHHSYCENIPCYWNETYSSPTVTTFKIILLNEFNKNFIKILLSFRIFMYYPTCWMWTYVELFCTSLWITITSSELCVSLCVSQYNMTKLMCNMDIGPKRQILVASEPYLSICKKFLHRHWHSHITKTAYS